MNEVTSEWVAKAEEDFHSADALLRAVAVPLAGTSCFHSQQCAEKYLKAFLQEHAVRFERKHDLLPLGALCAQIDESFEDLEEDLHNLERYAVAIRYPGTTASAEMAEMAFTAAERVRKFIRGKFGLD